MQWTLGKVDEHGAHFDLILWDPAEGTAISLEFRRTETGPGFMVIDAETRPISKDPRVARSLARREVVGTPLSEKAFKIVDAIWLKDDRIAEVRGVSGLTRACSGLAVDPIKLTL